MGIIALSTPGASDTPLMSLELLEGGGGKGQHLWCGQPRKNTGLDLFASLPKLDTEGP